MDENELLARAEQFALQTGDTSDEGLRRAAMQALREATSKSDPEGFERLRGIYKSDQSKLTHVSPDDLRDDINPVVGGVASFISGREQSALAGGDVGVGIRRGLEAGAEGFTESTLGDMILRGMDTAAGKFVDRFPGVSEKMAQGYDALPAGLKMGSEEAAQATDEGRALSDQYARENFWSGRLPRGAGSFEGLIENLALLKKVPGLRGNSFASSATRLGTEMATVPEVQAEARDRQSQGPHFIPIGQGEDSTRLERMLGRFVEGFALEGFMRGAGKLGEGALGRVGAPPRLAAAGGQGASLAALGYATAPEGQELEEAAAMGLLGAGMGAAGGRFPPRSGRPEPRAEGPLGQRPMNQARKPTTTPPPSGEAGPLVPADVRAPGVKERFTQSRLEAAGDPLWRAMVRGDRPSYLLPGEGNTALLTPSERKFLPPPPEMLAQAGIQQVKVPGLGTMFVKKDHPLFSGQENIPEFIRSMRAQGREHELMGLTDQAKLDEATHIVTAVGKDGKEIVSVGTKDPVQEATSLENVEGVAETVVRPASPETVAAINEGRVADAVSARKPDVPRETPPPAEVQKPDAAELVRSARGKPTEQSVVMAAEALIRDLRSRGEDVPDILTSASSRTGDRVDAWLRKNGVHFKTNEPYYGRLSRVLKKVHSDSLATRKSPARKPEPAAEATALTPRSRPEEVVSWVKSRETFGRPEYSELAKIGIPAGKTSGGGWFVKLPGSKRLNISVDEAGRVTGVSEPGVKAKPAPKPRRPKLHTDESGAIGMGGLRDALIDVRGFERRVDRGLKKVGDVLSEQIQKRSPRLRSMLFGSPMKEARELNDIYRNKKKEYTDLEDELLALARDVGESGMKPIHVEYFDKGSNVPKDLPGADNLRGFQDRYRKLVETVANQFVEAGVGPKEVYERYQKYGEQGYARRVPGGAEARRRAKAVVDKMLKRGLAGEPELRSGPQNVSYQRGVSGLGRGVKSTVSSLNKAREQLTPEQAFHDRVYMGDGKIITGTVRSRGKRGVTLEKPDGGIVEIPSKYAVFSEAYKDKSLWRNAKKRNKNLPALPGETGQGPKVEPGWVRIPRKPAEYGPIAGKEMREADFDRLSKQAFTKVGHAYQSGTQPLLETISKQGKANAAFSVFEAMAKDKKFERFWREPTGEKDPNWIALPNDPQAFGLMAGKEVHKSLYYDVKLLGRPKESGFMEVVKEMNAAVKSAAVIGRLGYPVKMLFGEWGLINQPTLGTPIERIPRLYLESWRDMTRYVETGEKTPELAALMKDVDLFHGAHAKEMSVRDGGRGSRFHDTVEGRGTTYFKNWLKEVGSRFGNEVGRIESEMASGKMDPSGFRYIAAAVRAVNQGLWGGDAARLLGAGKGHSRLRLSGEALKDSIQFIDAVGRLAAYKNLVRHGKEGVIRRGARKVAGLKADNPYTHEEAVREIELVTNPDKALPKMVNNLGQFTFMRFPLMAHVHHLLRLRMISSPIAAMMAYKLSDMLWEGSKQVAESLGFDWDDEEMEKQRLRSVHGDERRARMVTPVVTDEDKPPIMVDQGSIQIGTTNSIPDFLMGPLTSMRVADKPGEGKAMKAFRTLSAAVPILGKGWDIMGYNTQTGEKFSEHGSERGALEHAADVASSFAPFSADLAAYLRSKRKEKDQTESMGNANADERTRLLNLFTRMPATVGLPSDSGYGRARDRAIKRREEDREFYDIPGTRSIEIKAKPVRSDFKSDEDFQKAQKQWLREKILKGLLR